MKVVKIVFYLIILIVQNLYAVKIKDIVSVKGARRNPLIGYGLVIGLNGSGDSDGGIANPSLTRMFKKLGVNFKKEAASKNVAAVIVTAKLPPFARLGQKIDVTVSSVANASSLGGGTLLMTPLKAGNDEVYAVASGPVSVGGLDQGKKHGTTGIISGGGVVEKELDLDFNKKKLLRFSLHNSDFTTAARVEKVINTNLGGKFAIASDATTIDLVVPPHYHRKVVPLISIIENFDVNPSFKSKVVVNERTGTIVAGGDVLLRNIAISHGDLTLEVNGVGGTTKNDKKKFYMMNEGISLSNLVKALNALGADPEDIISIFQALKTNGAISGEIEFI